MITYDNLTYRYKKGLPYALRGISCDVGPGMHLLLGENGAGKTTLLKLTAGLLTPSSGTCHINGADISRRRPSTLADVFYLGPDTTVPFADIAGMARRHAPFFPRFDAAALRERLSLFSISERMKFRDMSLGTMRKAMLCYALSLGTGALLLDEPTIGLDIESKEAVRGMLIEACDAERTIIVSTHIISDLDYLYDGVIVLQSGELRLCEYSDAVMERLAFVTTLSEHPDALYSAWTGGALRSILTADRARRLGLSPGRMDYRLLYNALHSPAAPRVAAAISATQSSTLQPITQ